VQLTRVFADLIRASPSENALELIVRGMVTFYEGTGKISGVRLLRRALTDKIPALQPLESVSLREQLERAIAELPLEQAGGNKLHRLLDDGS
jgi:hypothetical protein